MNVSCSIKRILGYFPRSVWRLAWSRLRLQTVPSIRRLLSRCAGFAIRSPQIPPLDIPADLNPRIAAAIKQNVIQARERFLSGKDLAPLSEIAEKGVVFRGFVAEHMPGQAVQIHSLSVYPLHSPLQKSFTKKLTADFHGFTRIKKCLSGKIESV